MLVGPMVRDYIYKSIGMGVYLRIFPFELNPETKSLALTSSKIRLGLWIFNFVYCLLVAVVLTYRMVQTDGFEMTMLMGIISSLSFAQIQNLLTILVAVFVSWLCIYLQVALFVVYKQFPGCFQQIMNYEEYFCRRYASKGKFMEVRSRRDVIGYLAAALFYSQYSFVTWLIFTMFLNPSIPIHAFELGGMPTNSYVDFGKFVANVVLAEYWLITVVLHTCLWLTFNGLIVILVIKILEQMRNASWKSNVDETTPTQWTRDILRYPNATVRTYRELGILMKIGHDVGYLTLLNSQVTLYILIVLSSYILIRVDDLGFKLASANSVLTNILLFFTECILFDKVHTTSIDFLNEWLAPDLDEYQLGPGLRFKSSGALVGAFVGAASGADSDSPLDKVDGAQENQVKKGDNKRGKIKIGKATRLWMQKNRKSFKAFQVNLGFITSFDKQLTVNGLMCMIGYLIDILVTC